MRGRGGEGAKAAFCFGGRCYHQSKKEEPGMGASQKYAVIDPAAGKLDRRIFSDPAI
jgi:hypothetical protein